MFHSRQHLITWLQDNLTDRVLRNLLEGGGKLELLGGFQPLPGSSLGLAGWIVALTSYRTGQCYYVCIGINEDTGQPRWWRTDQVDWRNWDGGESENPLYCGDNSEVYRRWQNENL